MPATDDHLAVARHNEEFAKLLIAEYQDRYADWATTALFYAAVHYGRALLAHRGCPTITSHLTFGAEFLVHTRNKRLYSMYRYMKDESERARYDCSTHTAVEVQRLETSRLSHFRDAVLHLISVTEKKG